MRRILLLLLAVSLGVFLISGNALAQTVPLYQDITIYDNYVGSPGWYNRGSNNNFTSEDQEVEKGMQWGQAWDLEAFYMGQSNGASANKLTIVSGYNLINGLVNPDNSSDHTYLGDIFFKTSGVTITPTPAPPYGSTNPSLPNTGSPPYLVKNGNAQGSIPGGGWFYSYAIRLPTTDLTTQSDGSQTGTYQLYLLTNDTLIQVELDQNDAANPLKVAAPFIYKTGTVIYNTYTTDALLHSANEAGPSIPTPISGGGAYRPILDTTTHYTATIILPSDLYLSPSDIGSGNILDWWAHLTYSCGNDFDMGYYKEVGTGGGNPPVPVPPSVLLLASGLIGFIGIGMRKRTFFQV